MSAITEVTRRAIIDYLSLGIHWSGRLEEDGFLSGIYDLTQIPSTDHRYSNAGGDIRQHRRNNNDWPDGWVFTDQRFNILWASDEEFLKLLCETVHPVVRSRCTHRLYSSMYQCRHPIFKEMIYCLLLTPESQ
ncbi:hypothetical protein ACFLVW_01115 [Chloroflexota bacterium]